MRKYIDLSSIQIHRIKSMVTRKKEWFYLEQVSVWSILDVSNDFNKYVN